VKVLSVPTVTVYGEDTAGTALGFCADTLAAANSESRIVTAMNDAINFIFIRVTANGAISPKLTTSAPSSQLRRCQII
jgi:hypothetical protein